ncbi:MAG: tetratricopeptide repeat protein [Bacteroidetes bacterium]|nr:tetratricopeptide repeat protein [Bacteroidota bacterium]
MKYILLIFILFFACSNIQAQEKSKEDLLNELKQHATQDKNRVDILIEMINSPQFASILKSPWAEEALAISQKIRYRLGEGNALLFYYTNAAPESDTPEADSILKKIEVINNELKNKKFAGRVLTNLGIVHTNQGKISGVDELLKAASLFGEVDYAQGISAVYGAISDYYLNVNTNYPLSMDYALKSLQIAEKEKSPYFQRRTWTNIGFIYAGIGDYENALQAYTKANRFAELENKPYAQEPILNGMGEMYRFMGKYPQAINAYQQAIGKSRSTLSISMYESNLADVYTRMDSLPLAFHYAFRSLDTAREYKDTVGISWIDGILARAYLKKKRMDSAIYYGLIGLAIAQENHLPEFVRDNAGALSNAYAAMHDYAHAYQYNLQCNTAKDSILNTESRNRTAMLKHNNDLSKKETEINQLTQQKQRQRIIIVSVSFVLLLLLISAIGLLRSIKQKQRAKKEIQNAYKNLQATQSQLIQSEKMASLGELTAGIAHEIQNPLNFVNNFSEVSTELVDEMNDEITKGNLDDAREIANDLKQNLEKINHHGKRAGDIVKGMLQHSRKSEGKKEPTDINALCDEYLRLAYHGLRAKDKSFNADFKTEFDESIPNINVVPQDIGRVILNLINNAFYAVNERKKLNESGYEPTVIVSTKKEGNNVLISVKDNGTGIPQNIVDKIFQPFFTTKPTGSGTGLGLSLSYDIVKAHGGEIKVETKEGEARPDDSVGRGTEFKIYLPIS